MGAEKLRRQPGRLDITAKDVPEPKGLENPEQGRIIGKGRPDWQPCRTHGRKKARALAREQSTHPSERLFEPKDARLRAFVRNGQISLHAFVADDVGIRITELPFLHF
jgi:hypothetical protein